MAASRRTKRTVCKLSVVGSAEDPLDRIRTVTVQSMMLGQRRNVLVYLPPDYFQTQRDYPILYLLHGGCETELDWFLRGRVQTTLDRLIGEGRIEPLIVAMPNDGLYGSGTFFTRWYDGTGDFERHFLKEIVPAVEGGFRARAARESRAIAGHSMGGYAAVTLSLRHPKLFCAAASLSGLMMPASTLIWGKWAWRIFGPMKGRGEKYRQQRDPRYLVARKAAWSVGLHLNCGSEDFLRQLNRKLHRQMERIGRPHEYLEFHGEHDWKYWREHVVDALVFVDRQLHPETTE